MLLELLRIGGKLQRRLRLRCLTCVTRRLRKRSLEQVRHRRVDCLLPPRLLVGVHYREREVRLQQRKVLVIETEAVAHKRENEARDARERVSRELERVLRALDAR